MLYGLPDDEFIAMGPWARIKHILKTDRWTQAALVFFVIWLLAKLI